MAWRELATGVVVSRGAYTEQRDLGGKTQKRPKVRFMIEYRGLTYFGMRRLLDQGASAYANGTTEWEGHGIGAGGWTVSCTWDYAPGGDGSWTDGTGDAVFLEPPDG